MKRGPIYVWHGCSSSKGAFWHTIPPGTRQSGVANNLSWVEEMTVVTLANFVPHIPQEADCIVELGTCHLLGWSTDSSLEEDEQMQEEDVKPEGDEPEGDEHEEIEGQEEANPKSLSSGMAHKQSEIELEIEPRQ